jgi:mersacidin/lichenicidin family type 2 lantibiotic
MSNLNVIRAWKDAKYRRSLSAAELAQLPENPAGLVELTDSELRKAGGFGGGGGALLTTAITCTATLGGCCPATTAITCTATMGGCCPVD